jgi:hypothetical protein
MFVRFRAPGEPIGAQPRPTSMKRTLPLILAVLLAFAVVPARATSEHEYEKGEYAIIRDGLAPDKHKSLAAHGEGLGGRDHFHVWLMAEPAHRKIAALEDISDKNNLDTGPDADHASWSPDSRHAAVSFRSDRHVAELNLYAIDSRRAHLMSGPSLFREVTSRDVGSQDDLRNSYAEIEWRGPRRFVLREHRLFLARDGGFARSLGAYGKQTDKTDDGRLFFEFSAEADCLLMPGNRYRVVDLRVGKFGEQ